MSNLHRFAAAVVLIVSGMTAVSSFQQAPPLGAASLSVVELRTEYAANPLGIDVREPRLSWQLRAATRGVVQSAYQIQVALTERALQSGKGLAWDSGTVKSSDSVNVTYAGPALQSGQRYCWKVRVWDGAGTASGWSAPAFWKWACCSRRTGRRTGSSRTSKRTSRYPVRRRCCGGTSSWPARSNAPGPT